MPLIRYVCNNPDCDNEISKMIRAKADIVPFLDCGQCSSGKLERTIGIPSSKSTQIIDNGVQARKTEVMNIIVEKETDRLNNED